MIRSLSHVAVVVLLCSFADGCATSYTFSIVGDANTVGIVSEAYGARPVEARISGPPGVVTELAPGSGGEAARRLGTLLPAGAGSAEAPATRMDATLVTTDKTTLKVKLTTAVRGKEVVTEVESADLVTEDDRTLQSRSAIYTYATAGSGAALATISSGLVTLGALPCALVGLVGAGVCLAAAVPGLAVQNVATSSIEKSIEEGGSAFLGDALRTHAQSVLAAHGGGSVPASAPASVPVSVPVSGGPVAAQPGASLPDDFYPDDDDDYAPRAPAAAAPGPPARPLPAPAPVVKSPPPPAASAAPAAPAGAAVWFVGVDGEARGPMTARQVQALHKSGTINFDSLVWRDGIGEWVALRDVKELWSPELPPPLPRPKQTRP